MAKTDENNHVFDDVLKRYLQPKPKNEERILFLLNEEKRLRLNLSPFALSVIDSDMLIYGIENRNAAANLIFFNMWNYYFENENEDEYVFFCNMVKKYYNDFLSVTNEHNAIEKYLKRKCESMRAYIESLKSEPCGFNKLIVISKANEDILLNSNECFEAEFYGEYKLPVFFRCVLESYARKTYMQREMIMLKEKTDIIEDAVKYEKVLEIKIGKSTDSKEYTFVAKPYKIIRNPITSYSYLACFSREKGGDEQSKAASFRISRITELKSRKEKAFLSKEKKSEIEKAIKGRGIEYLLAEPTEVITELTQKGMNMYNNILTSRPAYSAKEKDGNMYRLVFECTEKQICDYFFKFGKEVRIVSPEIIRNRFLEEYKSAVEVYEKGC